MPRKEIYQRMKAADPEKVRAQRAAAYARHKDREREQHKRWAQQPEVRERRNAYARERKKSNPPEPGVEAERARRYREEHPEWRIAARARYQRKKAEIDAKNREWRKTPEGRASTRRSKQAWAERHPDKADIARAKRQIIKVTGLPYRLIPDELAEAKAAQIRLKRAAIDA